jgi:sulfur relay (sulfurtransferase) DsrF/TusC family protein
MKPEDLTKKQMKALFKALHMLDIVNLYATGDRLRRAFGVELEVVKAHKKDGLGDD